MHTGATARKLRPILHGAGGLIKNRNIIRNRLHHLFYPMIDTPVGVPFDTRRRVYMSLRRILARL